MKKLTRLGIEELKKTLPVLSGEEQRRCMGMYSGDCFWRSLSLSDGCDGSEASAEVYARTYWFQKFRAEGYSDDVAFAMAESHLSSHGAEISHNDALNYLISTGMVANRDMLWIRDPSGVSHYRENGYGSAGEDAHVVYIEGKSGGLWVVRDPSMPPGKDSFTINQQDVDDAGIVCLWIE